MAIMMLGKHRGLPDPDSFVMDFTLSEFDKFTITNSYEDDSIPTNSNDNDIDKTVRPDGIELTKKRSFVDMTDLLKIANEQASYVAVRKEIDIDV